MQGHRVRVFNFAAGPAVLPLEVLQQARDELIDWRGSGMSVMEVSHRSKAFLAVALEAEADLRALLSIPHSILTTEEFYTGAEIQWFGSQGGLPNWADPRCKTLACLIHENGQDGLYLMFNAATRETDFGLPALPQRFRWHLAVDTSRSAPQDLFAAGEEALVDDSQTYRVEAHASAILVARQQTSASGGGPA